MRPILYSFKRGGQYFIEKVKKIFVCFKNKL